MTFTAEVKNEIARQELNLIENRNLLLGYITLNGYFNNYNLEINLENPIVARKLFKTLKYCYNKIPKITVRIQKKFKKKTTYIFNIKDENHMIQEDLKNVMLDDIESKVSFVKGVFLATGSINNPQKSYHLELLFNTEKEYKLADELLRSLNFNFKYIKREKKHMLYLKAGEEISDFLKIIGVVNSLFKYEDIRIYRDHKNMVNRLNNCEQANFEKSMKASENQIEIINYLKKNDYYSLLDEKTRLVMDLRLKFPEASYQLLSEYLSSELGTKVTKSYINHHLRKINEFYLRIINKEK